jgi:hypothetical protein
VKGNPNPNKDILLISTWGYREEGLFAFLFGTFPPFRQTEQTGSGDLFDLFDI